MTHAANRPITTSVSILARSLIPLGALLALGGYFAPWVNHKAAGLAITGLDLGEYVKFLVPVQSGAIWVWREGFYLPLLAVAFVLALWSFRGELRYPLWLRALLLAASAVAALNMLPPAWTPGLLRTPEFRMQTLWILLALGAMLISPLLVLLPLALSAMLTLLLTIPAAILPVTMFLGVLPAIADLYGHTLAPAWGVWLMATGLLLLAGGAISAWVSTRRARLEVATTPRQEPA